jgi:2'-5' RNA ligase
LPLLYVKLPRTLDALQAHQQASTVFGQVEREFLPHISLFYGKLSQAIKTKLRQELFSKIPAKITLNRLVLVDVSGAIESWDSERIYSRQLT